MLNKTDVLNAVQTELESKITSIQESFDDANSALTSETKSSAGDKHETGRAMAQLEQEKLSGQLSNLVHLKEGLSRINSKDNFETIQFGSIVETSNGFFFLSVGLGAIKIGEITVFSLSITSPIGQQMAGKKKNDEILFNGKNIKIIDVN